MDKEEAIQKIEYIRDGNDFKPTDAQVKALDMAIAALKTQDATEELTQDLADRLNDAYSAGYNAAKREIALSGEYERAYKRGVKDAEKKCENCECGNPCLYCKHQFEPKAESEGEDDRN